MTVFTPLVFVHVCRSKVHARPNSVRVILYITHVGLRASVIFYLTSTFCQLSVDLRAERRDLCRYLPFLLHRLKRHISDVCTGECAQIYNPKFLSCGFTRLFNADKINKESYVCKSVLLFFTHKSIHLNSASIERNMRLCFSSENDVVALRQPYRCGYRCSAPGQHQP